MGRVSVDLYPEQVGVPLDEVTSFSKTLGGSPTNVAVAASRLGRRTAVVTKVGDDPFGRYVRRALDRFGVDSSWVGTDPILRTPLAFCEIHPPDYFPILFYRAPSSPDIQLHLEDLDLETIAAAPLLWTTGTGLSAEPSRSTTLSILANRRSGTLTVHDLDHRPSEWARPGDSPALQRQALAHATIAVGNLDEVAVVAGPLGPEAATAALLELGVSLAVVKLGDQGVFARTRDSLVRVPAIPVDVVNGLGAGDAFGGALCHGLLAGWELPRVLAFANAAGALVASRRTCADDMPTVGEVEELLDSAPSRAVVTDA